MNTACFGDFLLLNLLSCSASIVRQVIRFLYKMQMFNLVPKLCLGTVVFYPPFIEAELSAGSFPRKQPILSFPNVLVGNPPYGCPIKILEHDKLLASSHATPSLSRKSRFICTKCGRRDRLHHCIIESSGHWVIVQSSMARCINRSINNSFLSLTLINKESVSVLLIIHRWVSLQNVNTLFASTVH